MLYSTPKLLEVLLMQGRQRFAMLYLELFLPRTDQIPVLPVQISSSATIPITSSRSPTSVIMPLSSMRLAMVFLPGHHHERHTGIRINRTHWLCYGHKNRPHFHKDMWSAFSGSVLQSLLNTLSDIVHIFGAFKPFDDIAFAVNDKLSEIPFDI